MQTRDSVSSCHADLYSELYGPRFDAKKIAQLEGAAPTLEMHRAHVLGKTDTKESLKQEALEKLSHVSKYQIFQTGFARIGKYLFMAFVLPPYFFCFRLPIWLIRDCMPLLLRITMTCFKTVQKKCGSYYHRVVQHAVNFKIWLKKWYRQVFLSPLMRAKMGIKNWLFLKQQEIAASWNLFKKQLISRFSRVRISSFTFDRVKIRVQQLIWRWRSRLQTGKHSIRDLGSVWRMCRAYLAKMRLPAFLSSRAFQRLSREFSQLLPLARIKQKMSNYWMNGLERAEKIAAHLWIPLEAIRDILKHKATPFKNSFTRFKKHLQNKWHEVKAYLKLKSSLLSEQLLRLHEWIQGLTWQKIREALFSEGSFLSYLPKAIRGYLFRFFHHPVVEAFLSQMVHLFRWLYGISIFFLLPMIRLLKAIWNGLVQLYQTASLLLSRFATLVWQRTTSFRNLTITWFKRGVHVLALSFIMSLILVQWSLVSIDSFFSRRSKNPI